MTPEEIKDRAKEWISSIGTMNLTIGDLQLFAFDEPVSGQKVQEAVNSLAKEGFLCYVKSTVRNPINHEMLPCFRKVNPHEEFERVVMGAN
jgi:hypothetical protein